MSQSDSRPLALVTGATGGIGQAICRELGTAGFAVGIHTHRNTGEARRLSAEIPGSFVLQADLAVPEEIDRMVAALKERNQPLEILVSNAGFTVDAPLFSAKIEDLDRMFAVNVRAAWLLAKRCSRLMIRQKHGRILFISSVVASTGNAMQASYGMTKAALENLTRSLSKELAPWGILVNALSPGFIETPMTAAVPEEFRAAILKQIPLGRAGQPAEIARWVRFLASEAPYCTGSVIHVNGGLFG